MKREKVTDDKVGEFKQKIIMNWTYIFSGIMILFAVIRSCTSA